MLREITVNVANPPEDRWEIDGIAADQCRALANSYVTDLGLSDGDIEMLEQAASELIPDEYLRELRSFSQQIDVSFGHILTCNLYYDALKVAMGCTAFAIDTTQGPIHGRNLDWWTENNLLSSTTMIVRFKGAPAGDFTSIGWPGFNGVLSAFAPGRFTVTLNAVLSDDPFNLGIPIVYLLRQVFETAESYDEAVQMLSVTPIPCDCLLLVSGISNGQMSVIERTPSRHAIRRTTDGRIYVTNDYQLLNPSKREITTPLQATSCGRFNRISELLTTNPPKELKDCLSLLQDERVKMEITVQQMAFSAKRGDMLVNCT